MQKNTSQFHVLPVPCRLIDGEIYVEKQAANGIGRWSEHFDPIDFAMPQVPDEHVNPVFRWVAFDELDLGDRAKIHPLPWGYGPVGHLKHCAQVTRYFRRLFNDYRYLQFGISGCTFGDWPALGARLAMRMGRSYAVHTDWVTHRMDIPSDARGLRRLKRLAERKAMYYAERHVIRRASLGLFHGADTYEAYRDWCPNPQLIHDVHVKPDQLPSTDVLFRKARQASEARRLNIIYAGRAAEMKGARHWLDTLLKLRSLQVDFHAIWYGDGPEHSMMKKFVTENKLEHYIQLPGMASHEEVIEHLRTADVLMFCHMTAESPRILIESLNQGTPIVGFASPYPEDLIRNGGGVLVPRGDSGALAREVCKLERNRELLSELILKAGKTGHAFTDESVFQHRAELIKAYL